MGTLFKQPDLAATLKVFAIRGVTVYKGKIVELIVAEMQRRGGLITEADLASYRAIERTPVRSTFRDYELVSAPPPSSGGVHVSQILKLLEPFPLKELGQTARGTIFSSSQ